MEKGMIHYVYRDPGFEQSLTTLRERGGAALSAAKKAEKIIQRLLEKGRENSIKVGRLTRKGELRIRHGIKFDLGNGYRLVCVKKGGHLILLHIGTHEECSRWLEHNKGLHYEADDNYCAKLVTQESLPADRGQIKTIDPSDEYEEQLMKRIDDKILRNLFCGLVEKQY
jgi:hypothetical protein